MAGITKTAVLVNEPLDSALELLEQGGFDAAQLHGEESPEYCRQIREKGKKVVNSFGLDADFDYNQLKAYEQQAACFLFDAKTSISGGSGKTFGWEQHQQSTLPEIGREHGR